MKVNPKALKYMATSKDKNGELVAFINACPKHIPIFLMGREVRNETTD